MSTGWPKLEKALSMPRSLLKTRRSTTAFQKVQGMTSLSRKYTLLAGLYVVMNGLIWWLINTLSRKSLDNWGDMVEAYAWGISWTWGYDKHPPMSGWMAAGWFSLWPTTDWAFFLLSSTNLGVTFYLLFLAMRVYLGAQGALVAVVLTSMISLFGPDCGFRFNANTALAMLPRPAI